MKKRPSGDTARDRDVFDAEIDQLRQMLVNKQPCWSAMLTLALCHTCTVHNRLLATSKTTANVVDVAALAPLHKTSHAPRQNLVAPRAQSKLQLDLPTR